MAGGNTMHQADPILSLPRTLREAAVAHREGRAEDAWPRYRRFLARNPEHPIALELCGLLFTRFSWAESAFRRRIETGRNRATGWLSLGNIHQRREDYETAISCYQRALAARPGLAEAYHQIGHCLRVQNLPQAALEQYRVAASLGLDHAPLHHDWGTALVDVHAIDEAIDAFYQALERDPLHRESHRSLNSLLWQQDRLDEYLESYRRALRQYPREQGLRLAYAGALINAGDCVEAERIVGDALRARRDCPSLHSRLASALEGQGRWDEALACHARAVASAAVSPDHSVDYARALLACGRPEDAIEHAARAAERMPFDQRALAYLGLCWRLLGDDRERRLNDYENLVVTYDLPTPPGHADTGSFNDRLIAVLDRLHIARRHPADQTLRGGVQTTGDLLARGEPEIRALLASLRYCVGDYIARLPDDPHHPLFARRSGRFDFAASWSVQLRPGGYHKRHVHPKGWLSAVYYAQVPEEIVGFDDAGGELEFGIPDIDVGVAGAAPWTVRPAAGRLVVFPSYLWHGTVPFEADGPRMTVAFDVIPGT